MKCELGNQMNKNLDLNLCYKDYCQQGETLKFMFSKKARKIDEIFTVDYSLHNVKSTVKISGTQDFVKFCGLLKKHKLYPSKFFVFVDGGSIQFNFDVLVGFI